MDGPRTTESEATSPTRLAEPATRLARRLGTFDAALIGLGAMLGAGVFAAWAPAAEAAGRGVLLALLVAALVAYCNAASSAQLAALQPEAGGAYAYGRRRLGATWGFVAGAGFVAGKLASCAAMALVFASHAAPGATKPVAVAAVAAVTAVDYLGVRATARVTRAIVAIVLAALALVVAAIWLGGEARVDHIAGASGAGAHGTLRAAAFLFFAFAGYARIATLGEEVRDPARVIPRAIPLALGVALVVYAAVGASLLAVLAPEAIARSAAPLAAAVEAGALASLSPAVRVGAAVASFGVLLSLLAGIGRTAFAMAAQRDLPHWLAAVHPRHRVPHRATLAAGAVVAIAVVFADTSTAIGFSSFAVLVYYAIANASALMLRAGERRWPPVVPALGLAGCLTLAATLPTTTVLTGTALLTAAAALRAWRSFGNGTATKA